MLCNDVLIIIRKFHVVLRFQDSLQTILTEPCSAARLWPGSLIACRSPGSLFSSRSSYLQHITYRVKCLYACTGDGKLREERVGW